MSTQLSPSEMTAESVALMGKPLGEIYSEILQERFRLGLMWQIYWELFGESQSRVDILNKAAPGFFYATQKMFREGIILHLCRLTDPAQIKGKNTLSVLWFEKIGPEELKDKVSPLIRALQKRTKFARTWRDRRIGHNHLELALGRAKRLPRPDHQKFTDAIAALTDVIRAVRSHYFQGVADYELTPNYDARNVLYVLRDGLEARDELLHRLKDGDVTALDALRRLV